MYEILKVKKSKEFTFINKCKEMRFIFSGSGLRLWSQFGALKRLIEIYGEPKTIVGTSGGSVIASLYAVGYSLEIIEDIFLNNTSDDINLFDIGLWSINKDFGLIDGKNIKSLLKKYLNTTFEETWLPLYVNCIDIRTKQPVIYSSEHTPKKLIYEAVRGSMAIPFIFDVNEYDGKLLSDGGSDQNILLSPFPNDENNIVIRMEKIENTQVNNFIDFASNYIDFITENNMRKTLKKYDKAKVYEIKTDAPMIDTNITKEDIKKMIKEGYNSILDK